ncbi:hypothetical protein LPY66_18370 [Dehalobacter sp. DCM]|uniref:hypothetical protein n=1 Tax=Dehalobacter sp. DCM TaxID=2907827 RepID=UPI003081F073|nr:hypothetical protein LPY66_18370 [Dehalobacter sp. DCM]
MKVYELMNKLSIMSAGAEVRIKMVKELSELPDIDGEARDVTFIVKQAEENDNYVDLDGWVE